MTTNSQLSTTEPKGRGHQRTCIKDPCTKPMGDRIEGGAGGSGHGKMETTVFKH